MRAAFFLRVEREETIAAVAAATGLDPATISSFESGETNRPSVKTLSALSKHYGVSVQSLLGLAEAA